MKQKKQQTEEGQNWWFILTAVLAISLIIVVVSIQWKQDKEKGETIQIGKFSINNESLNSILANFKIGDVVNLCDIENKVCTRVRLLKQPEQ